MSFFALLEWLGESLLTSAPVVAVLGFFGFWFRQSIAEAITRRISYSYDIKLKELQARLDSQERANSDMRAYVLSGAASRRSKFAEREAEAMDRLWRAVCVLSGAGLQVKLLDGVDYDEAAKIASKDPNTREFFEAIGKSFNTDKAIEKLEQLDPQAQRPYVNELAWALYSAYSGIILDYIIKQKGLEHGAPPKLLRSTDYHLKELVLAALPSQNALFEEHPKIWFSIFLDILQNELLSEIKKSLSGEKDTLSDIRRANAIHEALGALRSPPGDER